MVEVFEDPQLQDLIHTALQQNTMFALRQRESCKLGPGWHHSRDQLPTISAGVEAVNQRRNAQQFFPAFRTSSNHSDSLAGVELDFWGNIAEPPSRRGQILARNGPPAVISTLVSDVAAAYFQLRELDLNSKSRDELWPRPRFAAAQQTLATAGLPLCSMSGSGAVVFTAAETIPIRSDELSSRKLLSTLLGNNPVRSHVERS